jgi:hypothetical protein
MRDDSAPTARQEGQGIDARVCRHLAVCMGVVSFVWILSGVLTLCVLWLRAVGFPLFGLPPDLGPVAWLGAAGVLLVAFGVLTNFPARGFGRAAATSPVELTQLLRALRRLRLLYALHALLAAGALSSLCVRLWCLYLTER